MARPVPCSVAIALATLSSLGCSGDDPWDEGSSAGTAESTPCPANETPEACDVLQRVNFERQKEGLRVYGYNSALARAALNHARDMADSGYFSHASEDGRTFAERAEQAGYGGFATAENIAQGQRNAEQVMTNWMQSPGHRSNILSERSNQIGVGYFQDHWVQVFGRR